MNSNALLSLLLLLLLFKTSYKRCDNFEMFARLKDKRSIYITFTFLITFILFLFFLQREFENQFQNRITNQFSKKKIDDYSKKVSIFERLNLIRNETRND